MFVLNYCDIFKDSGANVMVGALLLLRLYGVQPAVGYL